MFSYRLFTLLQGQGEKKKCGNLSAYDKVTGKSTVAMSQPVYHIPFLSRIFTREPFIFSVLKQSEEKQ